VSGNLSSKKKANYEIKTPTVTIGVRGTTLHIIVDKSGATATELVTHSNVDVANDFGDTLELDVPRTAVTSTPGGVLHKEPTLPEWAKEAIVELNRLLQRPLDDDTEEFALVVPPPPPPAPLIVAPTAPEPPVIDEGLGLDQAQTVASDTALNGGLRQQAVGVADQSAQGFGQHGGSSNSGSGGGKGGGGKSTSSSTSTSGPGNSGGGRGSTRRSSRAGGNQE
jgi:uncharacterized membrane protein YgcG